MTERSLFDIKEKQFALFLKKNKLLPARVLQSCLDLQKRKREAHEPVQLSSLLVEKGVLGLEELATFLKRWKGEESTRIRFTPSPAPTPPPPPPSPEYLLKESAFLEALKALNFLSEEQLSQAQGEQKRILDQGRFLQLSTILFQRRWITPEQLLSVLQQIQSSKKVHSILPEKRVSTLPLRLEKTLTPLVIVPKENKIAQFFPKKKKAEKKPRPAPVARQAIPKPVKPLREKKAPALAKPPKKTQVSSSLPPAIPAFTTPVLTQPSPLPRSTPSLLPSSLFQKSTLATVHSQALLEGKWVLLYFSALWCAPSKLYNATTWKDEEVLEYLEKKAICLQIDIDQDTENLSKHYKIRTTPTVLILAPDQSVLSEIKGYQSTDNLLAQLEKIKLQPLPTLVLEGATPSFKLSSSADINLQTLSQLLDTKLEQVLTRLGSKTGIVGGGGTGGGILVGKSAAKGAQEGQEVEIDEHSYKVLTEQSFLEKLHKGEEIENVYVKSVNACGLHFEHKVSVKSSYFVEADFSAVTFKKGATFSGTTFEEKCVFAKVKFVKEANFKGCFFVRGADFKSILCEHEFHFNGLYATGYVTCQDGEFRGRSIFTRASFEKETNFTNARFKDYASFSDARFMGRATLEKLRFSKEVTFSNSTFGYITTFKSTEFVGEAKFLNVNFENTIWFNHCKFRELASFKGSTFRAEGFFNAAKFSADAEFDSVAGDRFLSFTQVVPEEKTFFMFSNTSMNKILIGRETLEGHLRHHHDKNWKSAHKEYGLIKNNFNNINQYEDEDWAYLWEKRMERYLVPVSFRESKKTLGKFMNWLVLDVFCGYGTKPLNTLLSGFFFICLFALLYFGIHQFEPLFAVEGEPQTAAQWSIQHCFFYSFKVFAAAEIPSVEPPAHPIGALQVLSLIEAFLGIFMMTVMVIAFSRKVIR